MRLRLSLCEDRLVFILLHVGVFVLVRALSVILEAARDVLEHAGEVIKLFELADEVLVVDFLPVKLGR